MEQQHASANRRIFYGWWLVLVSGIVMVIATVPLFHAMTVWAVALERHFGWSRAQLGLASPSPASKGAWSVRSRATS